MDATWERQQDQPPSPQVGSCQKFVVKTLQCYHTSKFQALSLNLRALESVPGMVVLSAGQGMLQLPTPSKFSKATSPSVAQFTATSGLKRTNLKFLQTQLSIKKLESSQDIDNLHLFSLWWSLASSRLTAGPVSPVKRLWALTRSTGEAESSARQHLG